MSFPTFADFLAMGGHALYVWTSYALGALVVVVSIVTPARARRRFFAVEAERRKRGAVAGGTLEDPRREDASGST